MPRRPAFAGLGRLLGRTVGTGAAAVLMATSLAAQSSEFRKTVPRESQPGQTEIRKSRPAAPQPPADWSTEDTGGRVLLQSAASSRTLDGAVQTATATKAEIAGTTALTRFSLQLSGRVSYTITTRCGLASVEIV